MKYDLTQKMTRGAARTLTAFSETLFSLLEKQRFEDITVNKLCEIASYPRATFYNYFEDIYDLLDYCWLRMLRDINIEDYADMKPEERTFILFDRAYNYLNLYRDRLNRIMRWNTPQGAFVSSLSRYLKKQITDIVVSCPDAEKYRIPYEMVAEHYGNTIQLVLEWCFVRRESISKEQAIQTLHYLLGAI